MTLKEAFQVSLPKWPCCIVYGSPVTKEQALEIIRRTDSFFDWQGGNNREFITQAIRILHIPQFDDYVVNGKMDWDWVQYDTDVKKWKKRWEFIPLEYLSTNWVSSSYIGGPYGWCQPSGKIALRHNIGKWPTVKEVYNELCAIGKAFPFLSLTCVLLDSEDEEENPQVAVAFQLSNGAVSLLKGVSVEEAIAACSLKGLSETFNPQSFLSTNRENYFPLTQLQKWYNQVFQD